MRRVTSLDNWSNSVWGWILPRISEVSFICERVHVEDYTSTMKKVTLKDCDVSEVIKALGPEIILAHVTKEQAADFFGLEEPIEDLD